MGQRVQMSRSPEDLPSPPLRPRGCDVRPPGSAGGLVASEAAGGCHHGVVRVISLVPSITETLQAWGVDPVACTRFCERPDLVHVGGTKNPDLDAIVAMRPDLVVMDREENRREDYDQLKVAGLSLHATAVGSLEDVEPTLRALAARVGAHWEAPRLPEAVPVWTRAFIPIWRRPWMALGAPTYGSSLLEALGVANVFADRGAYLEVSLEEARAASPDVVMAPNEPYPFSSRQLPELVTVAPTLLVDGKDLFWWGVRTAGAMERLADRLGHQQPFNDTTP